MEAHRSASQGSRNQQYIPYWNGTSGPWGPIAPGGEGVIQPYLQFTDLENAMDPTPASVPGRNRLSPLDAANTSRASGDITSPTAAHWRPSSESRKGREDRSAPSAPSQSLDDAAITNPSRLLSQIGSKNQLATRTRPPDHGYRAGFYPHRATKEEGGRRKHQFRAPLRPFGDGSSDMSDAQGLNSVHGDMFTTGDLRSKVQEGTCLPYPLHHDAQPRYSSPLVPGMNNISSSGSDSYLPTQRDNLPITDGNLLTPSPRGAALGNISLTTTDAGSQWAFGSSLSTTAGVKLAHERDEGEESTFHEAITPSGVSNGNEPVFCPDCHQTFTGVYKSGNLQRHRRSEHESNGPDNTCEVCHKKYKRSDALLNHRRKKHPLLNLEPVHRRKPNPP